MCVFVCETVTLLLLSGTENYVFLFCRLEDLVVCAPFYHAAGVSGALYVYYNSGMVCNCSLFFCDELKILLSLASLIPRMVCLFGKCADWQREPKALTPT